MTHIRLMTYNLKDWGTDPAKESSRYRLVERVIRDANCDRPLRKIILSANRCTARPQPRSPRIMLVGDEGAPR